MDMFVQVNPGLEFSFQSLGQYYDDLLEDGLATFAFPAHANEDYYLSVIAPAFRYNSPAIPAYDYYGAYMLEIYNLGPTQTQSQPEGYGVKASNICVNNRCFNDPRFPEFWDDDHPTNETYAVTVGNSPLANNFLRSTMFRAGDSTSPTAGFQLDRIGAFVHSMTSGSIPQAAIHADLDGPGAKLFDLEPIYNDERHVDYFVAPRDAQALDRNAEYHIVFSEGGGSNESYKLFVTAKGTADDNRHPKWLLTGTTPNQGQRRQPSRLEHHEIRRHTERHYGLSPDQGLRRRRRVTTDQDLNATSGRRTTGAHCTSTQGERRVPFQL